MGIPQTPGNGKRPIARPPVARAPGRAVAKAPPRAVKAPARAAAKPRPAKGRAVDADEALDVDLEAVGAGLREPRPIKPASVWLPNGFPGLYLGLFTMVAGVIAIVATAGGPREGGEAVLMGSIVASVVAAFAIWGRERVSIDAREIRYTGVTTASLRVEDVESIELVHTRRFMPVYDLRNRSALGRMLNPPHRVDVTIRGRGGDIRFVGLAPGLQRFALPLALYFPGKVKDKRGIMKWDDV